MQDCGIGLFGRTGYLALYALDQDADVVSVLALRHQREADYDPG